jgi:ABC-type amino acid transport substrate-binding protein
MVLLAATVTAGFAPGTAFAQDTLARITADGSARIGIANERPYGYVETDGTVAGSIPDIVRAALAPHGVTELEPQIVDFNALIPGLNADRFDIIAAGMYINPQRCEAIAFTNPLTRAGYGFAAKAGNPKGCTASPMRSRAQMRSSARRLALRRSRHSRPLASRQFGRCSSPMRPRHSRAFGRTAST